MCIAPGAGKACSPPSKSTPGCRSNSRAPLSGLVAGGHADPELARPLAPEAHGAVDFDGFAPVDILVDQGAIARSRLRARRISATRRSCRLSGRHRAAAVRRRAHPSRQGPYLAARAPIRRRFRRARSRRSTEDRAANWSARDVAARMEFCLRCAYATGRARSAPISTASVRRRGSAGRSSPRRASAGAAGSTLQASPLFSVDFAFDDAHMGDVEAMVDAHGSDMLGAVTYMVPRLHEALDVLFALAERKGWDLDFHVDETADPAARSLGVIAETAIERRFPGRILVGHCCSLALQEDDERKADDRAVARAGLSVVSLPMCNMFLQDRQRRPHAALARRHRVARIEGGGRQRHDRQRQYARSVLRLRRSRHAGSLARGRAHPASRLSVRRLGAGGRGRAGARRWAWSLGASRRARRADMILTRARDFTELFARPQADRTVLRDGAAVERRAARLRRDRRLGGPRAMSDATTSPRSAPRSARSNARTIPSWSNRRAATSTGIRRCSSASSRRSPPTSWSRRRARTRSRAVLAAAYKLGIPVTPRGARHRQLRPGDAAHRRRAAQSGRDEQDPVDRAGAGRLRARRADRDIDKARGGVAARNCACSRRPARPRRSPASSPAARAASARSAGAACAISAMCCACACMTMEAEPRTLELTGEDLHKAVHAYGTNGVITEVEMPLTARYDWVDVIVGFDSFEAAAAYALALGEQDGILKKLVTVVAGPAPHDYFLRHRALIPRGQERRPADDRAACARRLRSLHPALQGRADPARTRAALRPRRWPACRPTTN